MIENFETTIEVRWADADANRHVRHSAYYDYGAHARIKLFADRGYDSKMMSELNIGPVIFKEECNFIRELTLDDIITVNVLRGEMSENGAKWILHHEIFSNGIKCAHISLNGAWLDLAARKLIVPPDELVQIFKNLPLGEAYVYRKGE